jgi:hypothetical protein
MSVIFNENKEIFDYYNPKGTPSYIFEGTLEEYKRLKEEKKLFLNKNVFKINCTK